MVMRGYGWRILVFNPVIFLLYLQRSACFRDLKGVKAMGVIENDDAVERIERLEKGERKGLYLHDFSDSELCLIVETCGESFLDCHFAG